MTTEIEKHSNTDFTVIFNGSDYIKTTLTSYGDKVHTWISEILRIHRRRLSRLIVGIDLEWRPSYSRHQNPIALLQLCVGRRCLIFQLLFADYIPNSLHEFLADSRFTFVGVGVKADVDRLANEIRLDVSNSVDLRDLAKDVMGRNDMMQKGLAGIAWEVMGVSMYKPKYVTMSRWDKAYLSLDQIMYACVDAFVSFEIGRRLNDGDF
ncbi:Werner Syndrome-like exonuclease [Phalaenopsis equestris]|uniref:Werner Syndrome-like exonuclease n=1 Tax=Phalaenopsis equestris TaxID=78828 RepID=UPI0009E64649|nr:Werner Syndrome-like exonuclease [Phalaenopsis equestris]